MKKVFLSIITVMLITVVSTASAFAATDNNNCSKLIQIYRGMCNQFQGNLNLDQFIPSINQGNNDENNETPDKENNDQNNQIDNESNNLTNNLSAYQKQVASLTNSQRKTNGLASLTLSPELSKVAQTKAQDMMNNGYFSHTSPNYGSPFDMLKTFKISYTSAGENIAMGQKTPEDVMNGWMNSSGHRANILNSSYGKIGVGYAKASNGKTYWVQIFTN